MTPPDYAIIDSTGQHVGTIQTNDLGRTYAVTDLPGEHTRYFDVTYRRVGPLDINGDGFVNGADYDLYLVLFVAGNQGADYDQDGWVTGIDMDTFRWDFIAGQ